MYNVPCMEHCVDGTPCMGHGKCMLIESTIYNWLTASAPAALFMMRDIDTEKCTYEFRGRAAAAAQYTVVSTLNIFVEYM